MIMTRGFPDVVVQVRRPFGLRTFEAFGLQACLIGP
jgi:hypothetical protein